MKKTALLIACALFSVKTYSQVAQIKKDTPSVNRYQADPNRVYTLALTADQIISLLQTSQAGVVPFLKAVKLPMDKLDDVQAYFNSLSTSISTQYRRQYLNDSLRSLNPLTKK